MIKDSLRPLVRWAVKTRAFKYFEEAHGDWRYLYMPAAWRIARLLVPRRSVRIGGTSLTLPCDNPITHFRWYLYQTKEPEVRRYIDEYVRDGDIFFDIGANIGVFSLYAAKTKRGINVHCFEPEYSNLHYLKENVLANGLNSVARIHSVAVGDHDGLSTLHIQDVTPGAAVHTESKQDIARTDEDYEVVWREGVAAFRLDTLVRQLNVTPNALKIDTDGNEPKILRGGEKTLRDPALRSVVIEMPPADARAVECADLLRDAGMVLRWSDPSTRNQIWARA